MRLWAIIILVLSLLLIITLGIALPIILINGKSDPIRAAAFTLTFSGVDLDTLDSEEKEELEQIILDSAVAASNSVSASVKYEEMAIHRVHSIGQHGALSGDSLDVVVIIASSQSKIDLIHQWYVSLGVRVLQNIAQTAGGTIDLNDHITIIPTISNITTSGTAG